MWPCGGPISLLTRGLSSRWAIRVSFVLSLVSDRTNWNGRLKKLAFLTFPRKKRQKISEQNALEILGNLSQIFVLIVFKTETSAKMLERYGQLNSNTSNEANSAWVPNSEKVKKIDKLHVIGRFERYSQYAALAQSVHLDIRRCSSRQGYWSWSRNILLNLNPG